MPQAAKTLCPCGGIKTAGVCSRCGPATTRSRTRSGGEYGGSWKRISAKLRREQPFCVLCFQNERLTIAEPGKPLQSHHIVPVLERPDLRDERDNILVLCGDCHTSVDKLRDKDRREYERLMDRLKQVRDSLC